MSEPDTPDTESGRSSAVAAFQKRRPGATMHLQQDRGASWMAWFFGALVVALVAGLFLGRFARSESVRGYVSAASGLTRLDARAAGIVQGIDVRQGDRVTRGQRLMQIQVRDQTTGGVSTVTANLRSLRERKANLQRDRERLIAFLDATKGDRSETESNVANVTRAFDEQERALKEGLRQQEEMVARVQSYMNQGYATRESLNSQRRIALDYARQIAELRARRAELKQSTAERLTGQRTTATEKAAQLAATENELSTIEAQLTGYSALERLDIVSPVDGQVAGLFVEPGASVSADQVLAIVGDSSAEPVIVLEVPARAIGLAKVGQDVVIKYDAFPFKTFGIAHGTITQIAGTPLRAPAVAMADAGEAVFDPTSLTRQSTYRIDVRPDSRTIRAYGVDEPIRIGSTLSADIVVEKRRLIDWMLDPIRAMRGRG
ncbi:HlyD family secretion protein [Methylobacterium gregans]|uniref:Colicin V secretion protein CvaA n=1 Tax=Methylobacterium gregans TaxID=374424 RepID=A0AA37HPM6_9HYPH|nr:HlyD family efflux transporter periplasmic adaptor subunit [Methylobacterium gregans]MDQ0521857.1 membrane fusion protein [Methylobacterium gregans]GJD79478.1 Colicin V secretion protein CvaA [Methylobacterium gregans]GLS52076.1 hemolysin secretion protein D [Methylobacterium gregans]